MSNGTFDFNEFVKESKEVLVNPKSYFSTMKTTGGIPEPLIKAVIYGAIAGAFTFLWSLLNLSGGGSSMLGGAIGIMAFIMSIISAVIGLFVGGVVLLIISSICKGNNDFEANVRVTAAVMVVMPISAFLGFAGGISFYLGTAVTIIVTLYSFWLLYNGLIEALKAKQDTVRILLLVFAAIVIIVTVFGAMKVNKISRTFNDDFQELMQDVPKE